MKEFELIKHFFSEQVIKRKDVVLGIGDDCAIVSPAERQNIAITTDTLVAGVHFPHETSARAIGHKSIAVNLSDLAAMGAEPSWLSLAITMPEVDLKWIEEFCLGVFELCEYYNVQLIGGDTTQGPLSITVTAQGLVPINKHLTRSGAKAGDWIYVTGEVGDAALALKHILREVNVAPEYRESVQHSLDFPTPRILAGQALRGYASAAIDLSDGIISDLGHLCTASKVGANIVLDHLPISQALRTTVGIEKAFEMALTGGDDYELLFTVSEDNKVGIETALANTSNTVTCIGQINRSEKITTTLNRKAVAIKTKSFEHFSSSKE
ncbi:thiamine-phosphate kinase [Colwellia sp. MB02u-6]|jgi:thiamine-monophosphate kinase|uniref:thiamine-phosphate kinase n=1 Tax=Colwellia sp. MB02u-6 TaxID=2759824 RepID=UPI0015F395E8|nr:thiamine-phosphate kinase [Colwellia sp. MB02u-6]MBA6326998.1 thiamine-phosphate kinase [Colwellia sp. MB02u-6]